MIPLKVISLERTPERRAEFQRLNGHLDYELLNAVDGMTLSREAVQATGMFRPGLSYTRGAHGLALSHLALWEAVIAADRPFTVVEDDAIFRLDFAAAHAALLDTVPAGWDIVVWGWNFNSLLAAQPMPGMSTVMLFNQAQLRQAIPTFQAFTGTPALFRLERCFGSPAYTISPAGARKFKAQCFPLEHFTMEFPRFTKTVPNTGIDVAMNRVYAAANSFVSFPPLVVTRNDRANSTIQNDDLL